jgi:hypothetical protein
MEPDDFMKRGYLLPEGCKDLIDAWTVESDDLSKRPSPSERVEAIRSLIDRFSKRLADPNLSASARANLERVVKYFQKQISEMTEDDVA